MNAGAGFKLEVVRVWTWTEQVTYSVTKQTIQNRTTLIILRISWLKNNSCTSQSSMLSHAIGLSMGT